MLTHVASYWHVMASCLNRKTRKLWTSRRAVVSDGRNWTRQSDWTGLLLFRVRCTSFHNHSPLLTLFLGFIVFPSVPMRKCLGKHSCKSSPFSIAILNGTCSLRAPLLFCGDVPASKQLNYKKPTSPVIYY